jgi:hypothetical protein
MKDNPLRFTKFGFTGNPSINRTAVKKVTVVKYLNGGTDEGLAVRKDDLPLQSWLNDQSKYINGLSNYEFYTAMAYTVRSHEWIGPWLRGQKSAVKFSTPTGFLVPLFPQVSALMIKEIGKPPSSKWAENFMNTPLSEKYTWYRNNINTIPNKLLQDAMEIYVKDLQRIIKRAPPLPKSMIVYRGISTDIFKGKIGAMQTLNEFASTAYVPQYLYGRDRYMRIKLLKGTRVLLLQGLNKWDANGEFEIVLNKGMRYIIRKRNLLRPVINRGFIPHSAPKKYITDITVL